MMRKLAPLWWVILIVVATFGLYQVKYEVQSIKSQIAKASRELESERESLHVVAAEWAYLNRPERLQALADKYLASSGMLVNQIAEIEAIPFPAQAVASARSPSNTDITPATYNPAAQMLGGDQ